VNRASSPSPRGSSVPIGTPVPQRPARPKENQGSSTKTPREMGILLIALGISELIPPEPIGMVFVVLGGLLFWPRGCRAVGGWFRRKLPKTHSGYTMFLDRFVADLERRYPRTALPLHSQGR
jgi:hypothetical protein